MSVSINGTTGLSLGAGSITFPDSTTQSTAASGFGFKNRIINGAMVIDQRNAGASVTASTATYCLDRWNMAYNVAGKYSVQQNAGSVTPPVGFKNYLGCTSLSAYSVAAGDYFAVGQGIEGFNIADLAWGTANASAVTVSFKVYSSLTGTFGGALQNSDSSRCYPFSYSIPVANTWTSISINIAGDTTGTWVTNNGLGIKVFFNLGTGTTYSGTPGAWAGTTYISATGATSVVGTNGATFYITGVQLEKGSTATSFDYRPYGTELALCQRYFQIISSAMGAYYSANASTYFGIQYPVQMRTSPSATLQGTPAVDALSGTSGTWGSVTMNGGWTNPNGSHLYIGMSGQTLTNGQVVYIGTSSSVNTTGIAFSAEL